MGAAVEAHPELVGFDGDVGLGKLFASGRAGPDSFWDEQAGKAAATEPQSAMEMGLASPPNVLDSASVRRLTRCQLRFTRKVAYLL
jgi:hypothetical protein